MTWIDTIVISAVVLLGLLILYRALKEPIDLVLGFVGKGFSAVFGLIRGSADSAPVYDAISYS